MPLFQIQDEIVAALKKRDLALEKRLAGKKHDEGDEKCFNDMSSSGLVHCVDTLAREIEHYKGRLEYDIVEHSQLIQERN